MKMQSIRKTMIFLLGVGTIIIGLSAKTPKEVSKEHGGYCEIETTVAYDTALRAAGVESVARIYPNGGHGYGLRKVGRATDVWSDEAASWLARFFANRDKDRLHPSALGHERIAEAISLAVGDLLK